jgi:hypothetical protein
MPASSILLRHTLVLAACLAGVIGMGMIFRGAMHASVAELARGAPFFLISVWWAGRELGRSMLASRANKQQRR